MKRLQWMRNYNFWTIHTLGHCLGSFPSSHLSSSSSFLLNHHTFFVSLLLTTYHQGQGGEKHDLVPWKGPDILSVQNYQLLRNEQRKKLCTHLRSHPSSPFSHFRPLRLQLLVTDIVSIAFLPNPNKDSYFERISVL